MKDPYLYPNRDSLINLFNETDEAKLTSIEADYTSLRIKELLDNPIPGDFNFHHLCEIHRYIFQDIYEWAGKVRIINIEKAEEALSGLSVEYSDVFDIVRHGSSVLVKMKSINWNNLNSEQKAATFADSMTDLWKVHPFREGNTRTIITFFCDFASKHGFPLDSFELPHFCSVALRRFSYRPAERAPAPPIRHPLSVRRYYRFKMLGNWVPRTG